MNPQTEPILCRLAATIRPLPLPGGKLPAEIQWMPPGPHPITGMQGGKPITLTTIGDVTGAERMESLLAELLAKAAAGVEDMPFFDFNHADGEASGHPSGFRWGGDDPVSGGIRATVEWTGPGRIALAGRAYRRFSPSFFVDAEGRVSGAPINMGGLVNRAAFKTIAPVVSREAGGSQTIDNSMPEQKPISAEDLAALQTAIAAKDQEISNLKSQIAKLTEDIAVRAKAAAKSIVDAAITAGKLAPQATELHAKWIDAIAATPALAETLNAIAPNAALATVITAGSAAPPSAPPEKPKTAAEIWDPKTK